ncbi:MAG TPA: PA14 domain-containing protein, partial [Verrucomicrobiae bacterium]|nr:PA14 domain-containing protein [Verrucomicrobiae bacterium]
GPSPAIGHTNFAVRWTGVIQPQYGETYTLTTIADDGVRLWVNGQLLISAWKTNNTTQTNSAIIALKAQQFYNIQLDYFQSTGNAIAQLLWSSPSTPQALIPQTQLYPYTNPPPAVVLSAPTNGAIFTAAASVSFAATADAQYNPLSYVNFFTNGIFVGTVSNAPYSLTATGLPAGSYTLTASAVDGSGLSSTSAPVSITVAAGTGLPYGLTTNGALAPFLNQRMPGSYVGSIPLLLSQTGAYSDTANRVPAVGLISYVPNVPFWSDGAVKSRYLGVPNNGGFASPPQQIGFAPTGQWTFPAGTVFVKNFDLVVDQTNSNTPLRRLETRLLVRDTNGAVYGVTYKWRPDNSDADLLAGSLTEAVLVTNTAGVVTQNWYYPSPADCLVCHTPVASYVLGVNTRQLNGTNTYPSTGVTDNQLRTLNRLGLFYPAFNEANITNYEQLSSVTNQTVPLVQRARSYLDANCAQCHQPGGTGITFDARYDTPLTNQNIVNAMAAFPLGYDHAKIVAPSDIWRSVLYDRMNSLDNTIKMPPLARNLIDTNAVTTLAAWINSLGGTPALAPPILTPASGIYTNQVTLTLQSPDTNVALYYTLDGLLPTTNSLLYTAPFALTSSATVNASAFEANYVNSVAVSGTFTIVPPLYTIFAPGLLANGSFQMQYWAPTGQTYILQSSTNLVNWTSVNTNVPASAPFTLIDPQATSARFRFYRIVTP